MNKQQFDVSISCQGIGDSVVIRAEITEEISALFEVCVYVTINEQVNTEELLNTAATISVNFEEKEQRYFSGIIESARFENVVSKDETNAGNILYLKIVPTFVKTLYTKKYRSFQNKSAIDIILEILKENNIPNVKIDLQIRDRTIRDFCVQYGESDFHFLSRLMEEEGLFYYFKHEAGKDTLYISDISQSCQKINRQLKIRKYSTSVTITPDSVYNVSFSDSIGVKKIDTYSYDYQKAEVISGSYSDQKDKTKFSQQEIYDIPFSDKENGNFLSKNIMESENSLAKTLSGNSYCPELFPGSIFNVSGSVTEKHNGEFLTISVKHFINQMPDSSDSPIYYNSFVAIPNKIPFRKKQSHFKNRIYGCQTAIVTGTADEDIFCDSQARIKVKFHWDSRTQQDENSSSWIRIAQSWAGNNFGALIIPRIGMEVLVQFVNGDPDKPIVVGCLYNGLNKPLEYADEAKTVSSFRTNSVPECNGFNELSFNDKKNEEEIFIHAQKDMNLLVEHDVKECLSEGSKKITLESKEKAVEHSLVINKGNNIITLNEGDYSVTIDKGNQSITIKEGEQSVKLSNGNLIIDINGAISIKSSKDININADNSINITAKNISVNAENNNNIECDKFNLKSANTKLDVQNIWVSAKNNINIDSMALKAQAKTSMDLTSGCTSVLKSDAIVDIQGSASVTIGGATVKLG